MFTLYQSCQDIFFGFGGSEANIIPSLASCIEIVSFPKVCFLSTEVVGCSLCPNYKEGSSQEPQLYQLNGPFVDTLFAYVTVIVAATAKYIENSQSALVFLWELLHYCEEYHGLFADNLPTASTSGAALICFNYRGKIRREITERADGSS